MLCCLFNSIDAECPIMDDSFFGSNYGGTGGNEYSIIDQGRITGIDTWGLNDVWGLTIRNFTSDSQNLPSNASERFGGWSWDYATFNPCTPFTLSDDDYIIGFKIYYDNRIYGLDFYTKSGFTYNCSDDNPSATYTAIEMYDECSVGEFRYLSGFNTRAGDIIDAFQPQFTKPASCSISDEEFLGAWYGGTTGGSQVNTLNQGRITGFGAYGLWKQNDPLVNGMVIDDFTADSKSASVGNFGGSSTISHPCTTFTIPDDDYIVGMKVHYSEHFIFGLDFYTLSGEIYNCSEEGITPLHGPNITSTIEYYGPSECHGLFYYLSGFITRAGGWMDSFQGQWTRSDTESLILAKSDACYDATNYTKDLYTFNPPFSGTIIGIELKHKSGEMWCDYPDLTPSNWGCPWHAKGFEIQMIKHNNPNTVYYPTETTEGVTDWGYYSSCPNGCDFEWYDMLESGIYDDNLTLIDYSTPYAIDISDAFSLQYAEGCCLESVSNNAGTACADVYFVYTDIMTQNPTLGILFQFFLLFGKNVSLHSDFFFGFLLIFTDPTMDPTSDPTDNPTLDPQQPQGL